MANVDIIIRMLDQTGGTSNKVSANLKSMATTLAAVSGAALAVGASLKKVYDIGREGAQLDLTTVRFDRLAKSIGTTSGALMGDLRTATRGLYSDMELAASATDFMALGLAKTHDEAVRLAAVSAGLNMNMNQLVLTMTNMTTMRFDALGVSVDGFKEKVKELEKTGMSTNDAFKEAFLQQAEEQLERVGHAADTTMGEFMQLEASIKNWGDALKMSVSDGMNPFLDNLNYIIEKATGAGDAMEELKARSATSIRVLQGVGTLGLSEVFRWAAGGVGELIDKQQELDEQSKRSIATREELKRQYYDGAKYVKGYHVEIKELTEAEIDAAAAADEMNDANKTFMSTLMDVQSQTEQFTEANDELRQSIYDLTKEQEGYKEGSDAYNEIGAKIDEQKKKVKELAKEHELASKKIVFAMLQQMAASDGLTDTEVGNLVAIGVQWGILDETTAAATRSLIGEAEGFSASLDDPNFKLKFMNQTLKQIEKKAGTVWDFFVNIHTSGSFSVPTTMGGSGGGGVVPYVAQASGGAFNGWALTGDTMAGPTANSELVYAPNGAYVYNASQTKKMLNSGIPRYPTGGAIPSLDGEIIGIPNFTSSSPKYPSTTSGRGSDLWGTSTVESSVAAIEAAVIPAVTGATQASVAIAVASQTQQIREAIDASFGNQVDRIIAALITDNPRAVGKSVAFEVARRS